MFPLILISFFSSIQALMNKKILPFPSETEALMTLISGNNITIGVTSLRMLEAGLHEENGYPLQYSYLENSMDRGVW